MKLSRIVVHDFVIWLTAAQSDDWNPFLTKEQVQIGDSLQNGRSKSDFLRSRALLNCAIGSISNYNSDQWQKRPSIELAPEETKKPELPLKFSEQIPTHPSPVHGDFFVSISHKKNLAVVLTSNRPFYGVDIEYIKPTRAELRMRVLTPIEKQRFPPTVLSTLEAFSFKESVFKSLNRQFNDIRNFHQCEILSFHDGRFEAQIIQGSAKDMKIIGQIFRYALENDKFIITVARPE